MKTHDAHPVAGIHAPAASVGDVPVRETPGKVPPRLQHQAAQKQWIEQSPRLLAQRRAIEGLLAGERGASDAPTSAGAQMATVASSPAGTPSGLPEPLRDGMEALSGVDLSDVRVHRNSSKPAQLSAHAYAQGRDVHLGPGQDRHLPHEAWHVVQQRQGRVTPTRRIAGVAVNQDAALETEADRMGEKAGTHGGRDPSKGKPGDSAVADKPRPQPRVNILQGRFVFEGKLLTQSQLDNAQTRIEMYFPRLLELFLETSKPVPLGESDPIIAGSNRANSRKWRMKGKLDKELMRELEKLQEDRAGLYLLSEWLQTNITQRRGIESKLRSVSLMISDIDEREHAGGGNPEERESMASRLPGREPAADETRDGKKEQDAPASQASKLTTTEESASNDKQDDVPPLKREQDEPEPSETGPAEVPEGKLEEEDPEPPDLSEFITAIQKEEVSDMVNILQQMERIPGGLEKAFTNLDARLTPMANEPALKKLAAPVRAKLQALRGDATRQYKEDLVEALEGYIDLEPDERAGLARRHAAAWKRDAEMLEDISRRTVDLTSAKGGPSTSTRAQAPRAIVGQLDQAATDLRKIESMFNLLSYNGSGFSAVGRAADIDLFVDAKGKTTFGHRSYSAFDEDREVHLSKAEVEGHQEANRNPYTSEKLEKLSEKIKRLEGQKSPEEPQKDTFNNKRKVRAAYRGAGQVASMNSVSANVYAYHALDNVKAGSRKWEWLHIRAASLGGATAPGNLVLGTYDCNTYMMPFESNILFTHRLLEKQQDPKLGLEAGWRVEGPHDGSRHAFNKIILSWQIMGMKGEKKQEIHFSPLEDAAPPITKVEVRRLQDLLKQGREASLPEQAPHDPGGPSKGPSKGSKN